MGVLSRDHLVNGANLEEAMHKSKLAGFIIDCQTNDLDRAAEFWGAALGMPVRELPADEAALYKRLDDSQHGLNIEVQKVSHASRVHLDIETARLRSRLQTRPRSGPELACAARVHRI
jgi:hypothetical protein